MKNQKNAGWQGALTPGTPAFSGKTRERLTLLLPVVCIIASFTIVSHQTHRRDSLKREWLEAEQEYTQVKERFLVLKRTLPKSDPDTQHEVHNHAEEHTD